MKYWKLIAFSILVGLSIAPVGAHAQAYHDQIHYDPSKCSTDPHGMVYVALGRRVFREAYEDLGYVHGDSPQKMAALPTPPKPSDPEGCPDHPIRGFGFNFKKFTTSRDSNDEVSKKFGDIAGGEIINSSSSLIQKSDNDIYTKICKEGQANAEVAPGLIACWYKNAVDFENRGRHGMEVQAKPEAYQTPHGGKYTLECDINFGSKQNDAYFCRTAYNIYKWLNDTINESYGVSIAYGFNTEKIPLKEAIAYDRELRRRIIESEVPNYPWHDAAYAPSETSESINAKIDK
jgi:hypothetical protein